jgi:hypothetical protein
MINLNIPRLRLDEEANVMSDAGDLPKSFTDLNVDQRRTLSYLIEVERKYASHWWTMLNEMRCLDELPNLVKEQVIGTATDHDRWLNDCAYTNKVLFLHAKVRREANQQMFRCNLDLRG